MSFNLKNPKTLRQIFVITLGLVILVVGFSILSPKKSETTYRSVDATIKITNHKVEGPTLITASQGDNITIRVISDRADELHLHGYNYRLNLEPNQEATLSFKAAITGQFEYELEKSSVPLGQLQ